MRLIVVSVVFIDIVLPIVTMMLCNCKSITHFLTVFHIC